MRAVGLTDLDMAARAIMAVPPCQQKQFLETLLEEAHVSDLWRKRTGRIHPKGGTGSLYVQASLHKVAPSRTADRAYCHALNVVLQGLEDWRMRNHKNT